MNTNAKKRGIRISMRGREAIKGSLFVLPFLAGFALFYLWPFVTGIKETFFFAGNFVGIANYKDVFASSAFQLAVKNTMRFIAWGVPLIMLISLGLALLLYRRFSGSAFFRSAFLLPLVLPIASIVMVLSVFLAENGVMNALFTLLGLPVKSWLNSDAAFGVLLFLYIWKNCGYNIVLFISGLNAIPNELYLAASLDGAGKLQSFGSITLPLLMPSMVLTFIFSIMNAFKCFREAYLLCGDYPHQSIYMLQHFMNNNFANLNYSRLFIAALFTFAIISVLVIVVLRVKRRAGDHEL